MIGFCIRWPTGDFSWPAVRSAPTLRQWACPSGQAKGAYPLPAISSIKRSRGLAARPESCRMIASRSQKPTEMGGLEMRVTEHAVVIAGGGPTGLMLAGELALAGVDVAIVERRADQELRRLARRRPALTHHRGSRSARNRRSVPRRRARWLRSRAFAGSVWTSATFPPGTTTCSGCGRTTSSASWPAGSASWR